MNNEALSRFPFTRKNWVVFGIGLAFIVCGYILLRIPPVDGFLSLTLAPILLVLGYCVFIPAAILIRDKTPVHSDPAQGKAGKAAK